MTDKKKPAAPEPTDNAISYEGIAEKITLDGEKIFIDPDTGEILQGELTDKQKERLRSVYKAVLTRQLEKHSPELSATLSKIKESVISEETREKLYALRDQLQALKEDLQPISDLLNEIFELEPFIKEELEKQEYQGATFDDILKEHTPRELLELQQDPNSAFHKVIEAARKAKAEKEILPQIAAHSVNEYPVALDKINSMVVFDFLRTVEPDGQITMLPVKEESDTSPKQLTSYYSLTFSDDLPPEIKRRLTPYDRLVYGAADALQRQNGDIMSISQIHRAMGNRKPPSKAQYKKIHDSIIKINAAHATLDCGQVRSEYGEGYIDYYGSLFPMEMQRAIINGQLVEGAIHILRKELPLMAIARGRNHQIKEIPTALLDSKLSQTDANLAMEFFTLEQLLKIKNEKNPTHNKILYSTIYEKMGAKDDKQKQRAKKAFFTYLEELKAKGFIISYKEEKTRSTGEIGVTFKYDPEDKKS